MKKPYILLIIIFLCGTRLAAQKGSTDSLQKVYNKTRQDTTLVQIYLLKGINYLMTNLDSGMMYTKKALDLSRKINFKKGEVRALSNIALFQRYSGDLPGSLKTTFETLPQAIAFHEVRSVAFCYNTRALVYSTLKDNKRALDNFYASLNVTMSNKVKDMEAVQLNNLATQYLVMDRLDSAQYFAQKAYDFSFKNKVTDYIGYVIRNFGVIRFKKGDPAGAIAWYRKSFTDPTARNDHYLHSGDYRRMAEAFEQMHQPDSCVYFAKLAFEEAKLARNPELMQYATTLLTQQYKLKNDFKNAFYYQQLTEAAKDSLFSQQKTLQVQNLAFSEQQRQEEARDARAAYQNRVRYYTLLGITAVFLLVACILWYANSQRKKANTVLQNTLSDLKKAQTQLIQSEKMASLGELTAGIAHEIQNPLNFVNNFSEVNTEMIDELEVELKKGNIDEALAIAADIKKNEEKINHHGKRADFIVKGMLEHSRTNTGEKQLTDMNVLCDEFLKLSYHGLRAKDKSFNAELETRFDPDLPAINVSQQDIGRVMLNLFNNAFYAVNQKAKAAGPEYMPTVEVSTSVTNGQMIISVRDNGNGIPDSIKDKIMQPFFTTKPTGEGTGLGLSLTYDMVVKGHGGSINVESKEGAYTIFTITLPLT